MCHSYWQLSSSTKEISLKASPSHKLDSKEEGNTKEDDRKESAESSAATSQQKKLQEESKEETKQDAEAGEKKLGKSQSRKDNIIAHRCMNTVKKSCVT